MTADQDCKVTRGHIENQLTFITVILVDIGVSSIERTQDVAKDTDGDVGDTIQLAIGQLFTSLELGSDISIGTFNGSLGSLVLIQLF